ncbi:MAG: DUF2892 domain-containing protein [Bacteroidetes bacterium]|nr:DUF2892 domain-containing protein [Bacteroidota bacterium]
MKKNMGVLDKMVRVSAAILIGILYFTHIINGTLAMILLIIAGVFIVTSFINFCPMYHLLGISTKKKMNQSQEKK